MVSKLTIYTLALASSFTLSCTPQSNTNKVPVVENDTTQVSPPPSTAPALLALVNKADSAVAAENPEQAIAYIERAIRIDEGRPDLWTRLAHLHLQIGEPARSEQLARKAVALSGSRLNFARDAWLAIADAREALGEKEDADKIRRQWQSYRG